MSDLLQKLWNLVTSRNVAIVLLIIVTAMLAAGAFLPNPTFMMEEQIMEMKITSPVLYWLGERYNSQKLASGKTFGFIGIFLILSTALCSIDRLMKKSRAKAGTIFSYPFSTEQEGKRNLFENSSAAELEDYSAGWFKRQRLSVEVQNRESEKILVGSRGKAGFWGSIFFHFILITALMGLVIYYFGSYRARLSITEGQSFRLHKDRFVHIMEEPVWGLRLPDAEVGLLKQYSVYSESDPLYPVEHVAVFKVKESDNTKSWEKEVRINDPLIIDGRKFLLLRGGFSPRIIVKRADGTLIFDNYVALRNQRGTNDDIFIKEEDITLTISFFPDFIRKGNGFETRSFQVKNPFYGLAVYQQDRLLYEGLVPLNGEAEVNGYRLNFPDVRRWVEMELVGEPGIGFFFAVSFAGLIGVFIRIIDPDERIYIILKEIKTGVETTTYTYSKHFSGLIGDKRDELVSYLNKRVKG